jgi:hypothetical protein
VQGGAAGVCGRATGEESPEAARATGGREDVRVQRRPTGLRQSSRVWYKSGVESPARRRGGGISRANEEQRRGAWPNAGQVLMYRSGQLLPPANDNYAAYSGSRAAETRDHPFLSIALLFRAQVTREWKRESEGVGGFCGTQDNRREGAHTSRPLTTRPLQTAGLQHYRLVRGALQRLCIVPQWQ